MIKSGVRTANISNRPAVSDFLLVNRDRSTGLQAAEDFARQLASTAPIRYLASGGAPIFDTEADLVAADLTTKVTAWVIADPDLDKIGIWGWSGNAWVWQMPLPYELIPAEATEDGTGSAIIASSRIPIVTGSLVKLTVKDINPTSPVTVAFNGGTPVTVKTNGGSDIAVGGFTPGLTVLANVTETELQLLNDQASSAIVAAAEAAATLAQEVVASVNIKNVATVAVTKALDTTVTTLAFIKSRGRLYQWQTGDYSAQVAADTTQAIFIKADDILASVGAWVLADYSEVDVALCGARYGSGLDDRDAIQAARELAYFLNIPAAINGDVLINSGGTNACSELVIERSATLIIRGKVKIGAGIPFDGVNQYRAFRYSAGTTVAANTVASIIGPGTIDMSSAPGSALPGVDAVSMAGAFEHVVENLTIDHSTTVPSGDNLGWGTGGDSGIFLKDYTSARVRNCKIIGCPDLGLYLSGDNSGATAQNADVSGNYFYRCGGGAIAGKRSSARHFIERNTILECMSGVFGGVADGADGNQGREWSVSKNDIRRTQGDPMRFEGDIGTSVEGNTVVDFRCRVSDGAAVSVSTGNWGGGVKLNGCINCLVTGNKIRFESWTAPSTANREAYGVALDDLTVSGTTTKSRRVKIIANDFRGTYGGVIFDGAEYCTGKDNDMENIGNTAFRYREVDVLTQNGIWDDYDFSATVAVAGGTGRTYAAQIGKGRREGRDFSFNIYLALSAFTAGSGAVTVSGLPFANDNADAMRSAIALAIANITLTGGYVPMGYIGSAASAITLVYYNGSTETAIPATAVSATGRLAVSGKYRMR